MLTRRQFVITSGLSLVALNGAPRLILPWRRKYSLVIRNGTVFDGLGGPGIEADVAIEDGKIVAIGKALKDEGAVEIDAKGMAVAPGFVDIHSHGDGTLWVDPQAESVVRQGITTIVVGQDGGSRAPAKPAAGTTTGTTAGTAAEGRQSFENMNAFWDALGALQPAVNVATMVGLGTIRGLVIGNENRPATAEELAQMTQLVEDALAQGACGASSGLEYTPGAFATRDELIALARPLAARRLPYATHMRNEDDELLEAVDESIAVAEGAGCPLQISHLKTQGPRNWKKLDDVFAKIAAARGTPAAATVAGKPAAKGTAPKTRRQRAAAARAAAAAKEKAEAAAKEAASAPPKVDVAFDRYPYIAYQTGLSNLFPLWAREGTTADFLKRIDNPDLAMRIRRETIDKVNLIGGWDNVQISGVKNYADAAAEGKRVGSFAKTQRLEPYGLAVALLQRGKGDVGMIGYAMSEENLERILAHPQGMVCSDGGAYATSGKAKQGQPHPRGLGAFPRVLGRYVRERKALTLAQAIHKMTALPASRIGLADRGRLAEGMAADVVIFDPAKIRDTATFEKPFSYPEGIAAVVVNGVVAVRDGEHAGARSGIGLRPTARD